MKICGSCRLFISITLYSPLGTVSSHTEPQSLMNRARPCVQSGTATGVRPVLRYVLKLMPGGPPATQP